MNYSYAGLGARSIAFALDYLIIAGYLILVAALGALGNLAFPEVVRTLFGNRVSGQLIGFLLVTLPVMLYFAVLEWASGNATWGKRKLGLRVTGAPGTRLSLLRSLGRTALKLMPWELSHTLIWQIRFAPAESSMLITAGFILIWLLIGANVVSLVMRTTHQTLYDQLAGTYVVATNDG